MPQLDRPLADGHDPDASELPAPSVIAPVLGPLRFGHRFGQHSVFIISDLAFVVRRYKPGADIGDVPGMFLVGERTDPVGRNCVGQFQVA